MLVSITCSQLDAGGPRAFFPAILFASDLAPAQVEPSNLHVKGVSRAYAALFPLEDPRST